MKNVSRHQWIEVAAYYKAEARNFEPNKELDDWLAAEHEYIKMQIALYLGKVEEDHAMTILGLQQLAKLAGVENSENIKLKIELIQSIQSATHHRPCFRSNLRLICHENDCIWRSECRKLIAEWCRSI